MRDAHAVAGSLRAQLERRLESVVSAFDLLPVRGVKAVADQVEQDAGELLREDFDGAGGRVEILLQRDVEARLFRAGPVIGEVQRLFRSAFRSIGRTSPPPSRECSSMFLTMESARVHAARPSRDCP